MAALITLPVYRDGQSILHSGINPNNLFVHGETFTINGTGFGTRTGYEDHINTSGIYDGSLGSNFGVVGRWDGGNYVGASERFVLANEGMNGVCLKATRVNGGEPNISLAFNYDTAVAVGKKIFSSVYVKHLSTSTTGGQWKYGRWQKSTSSLSDKANEAYWNASNASPDNKLQVRDSGGVAGAENRTSYGSSDITRMPHNKNKWMRMDMLFTLPSSFAAPTEFKAEAWVYDPDGILVPQYKLFQLDAGSVNLKPYGASGDEWLQHLYQNYLGNGDFDAANHTLWMDKAYENVGDARWIELANNADITLATKRFIQPAGVWSDTSVTIDADAGNITGSRWLHVMVNNSSVYSESV